MANLSNIYEKTSASNKVHLMMQLFDVLMNKSHIGT